MAALPEHSGAQKPKRLTIADWHDAAQTPVSVNAQEDMEEPEWRRCSAAGPGSTSHRCSFRRFRISAPSRDSRNAGRTAARPADRRLAAQRSRGQPPPAIATRLFCPNSLRRSPVSILSIRRVHPLGGNLDHIRKARRLQLLAPAHQIVCDLWATAWALKKPLIRIQSCLPSLSRSYG